MKPSILFVDDEPNILDGLRRMLHPLRGEWDMRFARSARRALAELARAPCDILVTDLLMPEMDGGMLLEEVQARCPGTVRIVLSGHPGKGLALKASRYAHQFLAKPAQPEELTAMLRRVLALRAVLTNPTINALITRLDTLPALPEVYQRIMAELKAPEPSLCRVAELISQDMGLSASMMKLVNSAFFGLRTRVSSPMHAVNLLGLDVISGLVLTVRLFSSFEQDKHEGYRLDHLWRHSLNTGLVCRALARFEGMDQAGQDDLYIAGLLHDVGKLILLSAGQDLYEQVLTDCRATNRAVWRSETSLLGCTHAHLGAYLLTLWNFSERTIPCIACHHGLREYTADDPLMAAIVHAANALDHELNVVNPGYERDRWDVETLEKMGFTGRLARWRSVAESAIKEAVADELENPDC